MKQQTSQRGFSAVIAVVTVLVIATIGFTGWYVWRNNKKDDSAGKTSQTDQKQDNNSQAPNQQKPTDPTEGWVLATTQAKGFSMKLPDGWKITIYPKNYLGGKEITYQPGTPASVTTSESDYSGHSLRFRASIVLLDDAGLGPQWSSPQAGLQETTENFSIGSLQGKRYKGIFSQDLNQTIYEYVFALQNKRKLDIVYVVDHAQGDHDEITTVEKAIKTIKLNSE